MINAWDFKRRCQAAAAASAAKPCSTAVGQPAGAPAAATTVDPQAPLERQRDGGGRGKRARGLETGVAEAGGKGEVRMTREVVRVGTADEGATVTSGEVTRAVGSE